MNKEVNKTYWKSVAQRDGCLDANKSDPHQAGPAAFSRRHFLEAAGFTLSLATLSGCGRAPEVTALPFAACAVSFLFSMTTRC